MEVEPGDGRVRLEESLELMIISAHMVIDGRESALISIVVQPHWLQQKNVQIEGESRAVIRLLKSWFGELIRLVDHHRAQRFPSTHVKWPNVFDPSSASNAATD